MIGDYLIFQRVGSVYMLGVCMKRFVKLVRVSVAVKGAYEGEDKGGKLFLALKTQYFEL